LEIGPGTGNLTQLLLEKGKKVIAIEIDPRMVAELTKRFKYSDLGHKFELIQGIFANFRGRAHKRFALF
jgi:18S rRNA (adenine1779-N6/adenine1780-N6)-dimethyltransferase